MQKEDIIEAIEGLQIQDDFTDFVEYVSANKVKLTGTGRLGFKDCFNINQKLYHSIPTAHNKVPMDKFPSILFYFYIGQAAGIVRKHKEKSNTFLVVDEEAFEYFKSFNKVEQYFALLNNFFLNCQIEELTGEDRASNSVEDIDNLFTECYTSNFKSITDRLLFGTLWRISHVIRQFSILGWLEFDEEAVKDVKRAHITEVTFTGLGKLLITILREKRPILYWNKFARLGQSYLYEETFMMMREVRGDVNEKDIKANLKKVENEVFEAPFQEILGEVLNKLWQVEEATPQLMGNYIFKVKLTNKIWRKIAIASNATFEELHLIIQEAFNFGDDHMYAFYPSGKLYTGTSINSPWGSEPPFTDETRLSEFRLLPGTKMIYLFDFGDHWEFSIELDDMNNEKPLKAPKIIESKGEPPEQYPDWEEEDY